MYQKFVFSGNYCSELFWFFFCILVLLLWSISLFLYSFPFFNIFKMLFLTEFQNILVPWVYFLFFSQLLQKGVKKSFDCFYFLDPCILNVTDMNSNNIELKWRQEEFVFLHGDLIEFECKRGYKFPHATLPSPGRTRCDRGRLKYPKCVLQGKTILSICLFDFINLRPIQKLLLQHLQA